MPNSDLSHLRSTIHAALLTSIRDEMGAGPLDRARLLECYTSLKRTLTEAPSPNTAIISDMQYRAILAVELDAIFNELYDNGRNGE